MPLATVEGNCAGGLTVTLADGTTKMLKAMFAAPQTRMASPIAEQLGCDFEEGPQGTVLKVDDRQQTSIRGVYAAGDMARFAQNVAFAVSSGAWAGIAAHQSLIFD